MTDADFRRTVAADVIGLLGVAASAVLVALTAMIFLTNYVGRIAGSIRHSAYR
jgi:hypothetical protein